MWWVSLARPQQADALEPLLSSKESHSASSRREPFRSQFVIARGALRIILSRYVSVEPARLDFADGPHGKPALVPSASLPDIRFNVSHSGDLMACAVASGREIGVDIERLRTIPEADAIAAMVFTPTEAAAARAAAHGHPEEWFLRCWVRKEALLKAIGLGIAAGATNREQNSDWAASPAFTVRDLETVSGFVGALAVEGGEGRVRYMTPSAEISGLRLTPA